MKPLAYRMRPTKFEDVFGQDHLIGPDGVLNIMLKKHKILSFILYGPPGTGKTTIAQIFANESALDTYFFNASTDNKAKLKDIVDMTAYHDVLLIIDEIHRMKTDIQDYLLPFLENGHVTIIGLTTLNPYQSINLAIRSRCHLYEVKKLDDNSIASAIHKGLHELDVDIKIEPQALDAIIRVSNHEIRSALNVLESSSLLLEDNDILTSHIVYRVAGKTHFDLDKNQDNFYDLLSALQKSIRGLDVDASIHYLARLITLEDLQSIIRRLLVIAYEDIGLANPMMGVKVANACESVLKVGLPEARIILSVIVIDMALSPKSNSAYLAIDQALEDYQNSDTGVIAPQSSNREIAKNPDLYLYPHDHLNSINDQSYMPDKIKDKVYFKPKKESSYEKALATRLEQIDKIKHKKR
ncbi:replication-associated recombination protein A [Mycoplasmatota bacterium]|nr:replication-associated recombination protein A [Mycoplasmatota bacterium]